MSSNLLPECTVIIVDELRRVDVVGERLWQKNTAIGTPCEAAHKTECKEILEVFQKGKGVSEELAEMELLLVFHSS